MISEYAKRYIKAHIAEKREDGRRTNEYRNIEVETNVIEKAEGSAHIRIGNTEVIVGVKLDVGEPFPDTPKQGVLMVGAEFSPIADPDFESGPPGENATELARVVDRGIRESHAVDLDKLFIEEKKVWIVFVDIHILNNDGNLIDACGIASIAALLTSKIPKLNEDKTVNREEYESKLKVVEKPIPVTITKINRHLVLDCTEQEEESSEGRITVTCVEDGTICAMQKSGSVEFTEKEINEAIDFSVKEGNRIRKLLK